MGLLVHENALNVAYRRIICLYLVGGSAGADSR